jgi:hypothetical protein
LLAFLEMPGRQDAQALLCSHVVTATTTEEADGAELPIAKIGRDAIAALM